MKFAGIDPGLDGAIAVVSRDDVAVVVMPTIKMGKGRALDVNAVVDILRAHRPDYAIIERQFTLPKQSAPATFTTGTNYGILLGILAALGIRHEVVSSQALKKAVIPGTDGSKGAAIQRAQRLFPDVSLRATEKCRIDHDGMAEALLFAEYARRALNR